MSVTADIQLDISEPIRAQPELLAQVELASDYFVEKYQTVPPLDHPTKRRLAWSQKRAGEPLLVTFVETDANGTRTAKQSVKRFYLSDPTVRDVNILRLLGRLMGVRSDEGLKRLDRVIWQWEDEEERDARMSD